MNLFSVVACVLVYSLLRFTLAHLFSLEKHAIAQARAVLLVIHGWLSGLLRNTRETLALKLAWQ